MFRVHLEKLVVGDTASCVMQQDLVFPFAPFPGLEIVFGDEEQGDTVAEVVWLVKAGRFVVTVQPWEAPATDFKVQMVSLKGRGWQVMEDSLRTKK
jgi:hypothetical protein